MLKESTTRAPTLKRASLSVILKNWLTTLFAYQPEIYYQLDQFRRRMGTEFISPERLHNELLKTGLLRISTDEADSKRLILKLDSDMFTEARGVFWSVIVKKNGDELEFACTEDESGLAGKEQERPRVH